MKIFFQNLLFTILFLFSISTVVGEQNIIFEGVLPNKIEIPRSKTLSTEVKTETDTENPTISEHYIREFIGFTISYREAYEQAEWAAYTLTPSKLIKEASRADNFRIDPNIPTFSATLEDYRASGYDRGHLAPAADMAYNKQVMSESFYMSNMSPQNPSFNRGIWGKLEASVRKWAENSQEVYIVTGPILEKLPSEYLSIGINKVTIPEYYYKVLLFTYPVNSITENTSELKKVKLAATAFILPNTKSSEPITNYICTIDNVEDRTNLDFFYLLDDQIEDLLESSTYYPQ